ncbi:hypothetical protein KKH30_04865, partial [Candidatus Micrarchaeota archaeon]|nr:hypothetical protein [Candidatus Micrarchaeota archaeon]MBU1940067.1 hypothetical protein [Candidatus Micrarchaeota archaeon]
MVYFGKHLIDLDSHKYSRGIKPDSDSETAIPIIKQIANIPALEIFRNVSDNGKRKHSILLESAEFDSRIGNKSICSADPCLNIIGRKQEFEINALNRVGREFIGALEKDLGFCKEIEFGKKKIRGAIQAGGNMAASEEERLRITTHFDVLRKIAFKFKAPKIHIAPYIGLFGAISYDFIDQFEDLPPNKQEGLDEPLYEMDFFDNLFFADYLNSKVYAVASALPLGGSSEESIERC